MADEKKNQLQIWTDKSRFFRVIHVDGAHGNVAPNGKSITMSLYSERKPMPKWEKFNVDMLPTGQVELSERVEQDEKPGVFREVEVTAILDQETAQALAHWLLEKAKEMDDVRTRMSENERRHSEARGSTGT